MRCDGISETVRVLIVEDNPSEVRLIRYALAEIGDWRGETTVAEDGEKALAYLQREGPYAQVSPPHLVILDLNLPKYPGIEVLKAIRGRLEIQNLPVVILSSSPQDVIENTAHDGWSGLSAI